MKRKEDGQKLYCSNINSPKNKGAMLNRITVIPCHLFWCLFSLAYLQLDLISLSTVLQINTVGVLSVSVKLDERPRQSSELAKMNVQNLNYANKSRTNLLWELPRSCLVSEKQKVILHTSWHRQNSEAKVTKPELTTLQLSN